MTEWKKLLRPASVIIAIVILLVLSVHLYGMEFGEIKGFDAMLTADAGVIVLGNINAERFDINKNMVEHISEVFGESATLDRFHGFIPGWEIPRLTTGLIAKGWAINTEYFAEVMHALRDDLSYASVVDAMLR